MCAFPFPGTLRPPTSGRSHCGQVPCGCQLRAPRGDPQEPGSQAGCPRPSRRTGGHWGVRGRAAPCPPQTFGVDRLFIEVFRPSGTAKRPARPSLVLERSPGQRADASSALLSGMTPHDHFLLVVWPELLHRWHGLQAAGPPPARAQLEPAERGLQQLPLALSSGAYSWRRSRLSCFLCSKLLWAKLYHPPEHTHSHSHPETKTRRRPNPQHLRRGVSRSYRATAGA